MIMPRLQKFFQAIMHRYFVAAIAVVQITISSSKAMQQCQIAGKQHHRNQGRRCYQEEGRVQHYICYIISLICLFSSLLHMIRDSGCASVF
mmetsp:Transcript_25896/g.56827  ORF Transcript_25896/g.56827 Transcript_25896/m.56827 type:complete len:91 (-) Transcript_25896:192-464(-)